MITFSRALARTLRTVFRRAGIKPGPNANLLFQPAGDELIIQARSAAAAVQYRLPVIDQSERTLIPLEFLEATEGRTDDPVTLESRPDGKIMVQWSDRGIPQMLVYDADKSSESDTLPALPTELTSNPPALLQALRDASNAADREAIRYSLNHIHLRGSAGQIVTTDGRQVLRQSGFNFPWTDDLLVPALGVFGCKELPQDEPISVGKTDDRVVLRVGPWTLWLWINKDGRFPKVDDLFRPASSTSSRLTLSPTDVDFLRKSMPSLPCDDQLHDPVTIDLNERVAIRARREGQSCPTELILANSSYTGDAVTINTNRKFLSQALKLGFGEVCFFSPNSPAQCDDGGRQYLWALLEPKDAIKPSEDAVRIESPSRSRTMLTSIPFKPRRNTITMPAKTSEPPVEQPTEQASAEKPRRRSKQAASAIAGSPIDQAIALRTALRAAACQTNELIRSLKRQKRQTKLVASTLESLKQLQKVAG